MRKQWRGTEDAAKRVVWSMKKTARKGRCSVGQGPTRGCISQTSTIMVRKLKYHEQKLLKKVDFLNVRAPCIVRCLLLNPKQWKQDANLREIKVMRRYHVQNR